MEVIVVVVIMIVMIRRLIPPISVTPSLHLMCASCLPASRVPCSLSKSPFSLHFLFSPAGILLQGLTQIPSPEPGEPHCLLRLLVLAPSSPGAPSLLPAPCTRISSPYHSRKGTDRFVKNVLGCPTNSALPLYPE